MRVNRFFSFTLFLFFSVQLAAMPPHPDMIEQYKKSGNIKSLMNTIDAMNVKMNLNSPLKSFSSSGERKVPVLLVRYAASYGAAPGLFLSVSYSEMGGSWINILFAAALVILISSGVRKYSIQKRLVPVFMTIVIPALSCGVERDDFTYDSVMNPVFYSSLLNGSSQSDLSLKKYYRDMSNGNLNLTFDVYGPVTVSKPWYYYGKNSSSGDMYPGELAGEALRLMVSKYSTVDFSKYDNDGSGDVDAVIIIHEGMGEEAGGGSDTIWSHQWDLTSAAVSGDGNGPVNAGGGVIFNIYTMQPEYTKVKGDSSIGVFAHEFGHVLGLPDLYDTGGYTNGAGDWSLMASGSWKGPVTDDGTTPAPLLAWERYRAGGASWVNIISITATTALNSIDDIEVSGEVYKVNLDLSSGQYLIIEGKTQSTSTQWYVAGTGVLITHIHETVISTYTQADTVNSGSGRVHGVNIIEADGTEDLWAMPGDKGTAADLYISGVEIADAIKYDTLVDLSSTATGIRVYNFSSTTLPMTFDVDI